MPEAPDSLWDKGTDTLSSSKCAVGDSLRLILSSIEYILNPLESVGIINPDIDLVFASLAHTIATLAKGAFVTQDFLPLII